MSRGKVKADCRADTRGGPWAGIPKCLIDSSAYRDLSLHARAVLVELVARMNGYNNGEIAVSQRELVQALGCSPNRVVTAIGDLMTHGLLDVASDGQWKQRQARLYRLTFVSTRGAGATNDYLQWTPQIVKSGATGAVSAGGQSGTGAVAEPVKAATGAVARLDLHKQKTAKPEIEPATGAVSLIYEPYPTAETGEQWGQAANPIHPQNPIVRCMTETGCGTRICEQCQQPFALDRADRAQPRRFCSDHCRKSAERARAYRRRKERGGEPAQIGTVLNGIGYHMPVAGMRH